MRGPGVVPDRPGTTALRTARQRFDQLVLDVVTPLDERWHRHLGLVEYAVEDAPMLPDDWGDETVPLSSLVRGKGQQREVKITKPGYENTGDLIKSLVSGES
jgi:hypothetical protein